MRGYNTNDMAKATKKRPASEVLRAAISKSGLSYAELARRAHINHGQIVRFMARQRTLTLPAVDALAEVLGLSLTQIVRLKRTRGRQKGR